MMRTATCRLAVSSLPFARDDCMLLQKKKQIQESTILLERMVCESEELDRRLEQQKREYNASLLAMKKIHRLLVETDYFLADQAKKMEEYKKETNHRRQQRVSQSENLLRILMSPSVDDQNDRLYESACTDRRMCVMHLHGLSAAITPNS